MIGLDEQLARIAAKAKAAAEVPDNHTIFGARKHRFMLNPPLADSAVAAFEHAHGVQLPEAYRRFITLQADGGAGPGYGLLPLADAYLAVSDPYPGYLSAPSPFEPGVTYSNDWWSEFTDEEHHRDPCQGAIAVVHHGCTSYTLLIVSGSAHGRLVSIDENGVPAPYILEDTDFLSWYERWLDELAAGYHVTHMCHKIPGGEDELLTIATTDPDHERRARAASSLCALPSLTPSARATLVALVADPIAPVRAIALRVVRCFQIAEAEGAARTALGDIDPAVRTAAISALREQEIPDLAAVARQILSDPDEEVITRAVWSLRDSGEMTVADLAPLASNPDRRIRVTAIHYLRDAAGDDGIDGLLTAALGDAEASVRCSAVQVIEHRNLLDLQPRLAELLKTETDPTVLVNLRRALPKLAENRP